MNIILNDTDDTFSDNIVLTDGNLFDLTIGMSQLEVSGEEQNMNKLFRSFSYHGKRNQSGYKYYITGAYNIPKFSHNVSSAYYEGTTATVMKRIAQECEIDTEIDGVSTIDPTEDSQIWFNINETPMSFSRKLALHSYMNDGLMLHCVTSDNTLWYKDVIKLFSKDVSAVFTATSRPPEPNVYPVYEWDISSDSGVLNAWVNYGYNLTEPKLDKPIVEHNTITLTSDGGFAAINKDVQDAIGFTRKDYAPIDCGNTHDNYWLAYHANIRRMALFSQSVTLLVNSVTNISPLEVVMFEVVNSKTGKTPSLSGKYLVTSKKTIIRGTRYAEIFELVRPTYPIEGFAKLVR
jgi:hypothetical protein